MLRGLQIEWWLNEAVVSGPLRVGHWQKRGPELCCNWKRPKVLVVTDLVLKLQTSKVFLRKPKAALAKLITNCKPETLEKPWLFQSLNISERRG